MPDRLIDTNILVYESTKHDIAKDILKQIWQDGGGVERSTTTLVMIKSRHCLIKKALPDICVKGTQNRVVHTKKRGRNNFPIYASQLQAVFGRSSFAKSSK